MISINSFNKLQASRTDQKRAYGQLQNETHLIVTYKYASDQNFIRNTFLPGQIVTLQVFCSVRDPAHFNPPSVGVGFVHDLCLTT